MVKRVIYTDRAYDDIDRIIAFNNLRNGSNTYSRNFLKRLKNRLIKLSKQPLTGLKTDDPDALLLVWDYYYIFYKLTETSVEIAAIYHQKEDVAR